VQCAQSSCGILVCTQILGAAPRSDIDFTSIDVFPRVLPRIWITLSFGVLALRGTGESAQNDIPGNVTDAPQTLFPAPSRPLASATLR